MILKSITHWRNSYLTPLGKVTLIKTLFLPKCIHMLTPLERSEKFLSDLNQVFFKFVWAGGPDKVKRSTICSNYFQGGLKMINVHNFEKALKTSWVPKLLFHQKSQWYKLLLATHESLDKLLIFGDKWVPQFLQKVTNRFWKNVLIDWSDMGKKQPVFNASDILQSCIWFNSKISENLLFFMIGLTKAFILFLISWIHRDISCPLGI